MAADGVRLEYIATALGRTRIAVVSRRVKLFEAGRCSSRNVSGQGSRRDLPWLEHEEEQLEAMISAGHSSPVIARALGRFQTEIGTKIAARAEAGAGSVNRR